MQGRERPLIYTIEAPCENVLMMEMILFISIDRMNW